MKLALYQPWIYLHGGLERSILEYVSRSRHDWTIFTGHYDREGTFPGFAKLDVRVVGRTTVERSMLGVLQSALDVARLKLPVDPGTDAIVVWCDGLGDLITFRNSAYPLFNICSTPLRAAFDPVYEALALRHRSLAQRMMYQVFKALFRGVDRLAWRRYDGVVATSAEVRNRILQGGLCCKGGNMVMAYPGIEWRPEPGQIEYQPFILLPGRIMWTKNIQQGIRAFQLNPPPEPWRLVIAGYVDRKSQGYLEDLRRIAGHDPRIEFRVNPTDEAMAELYRTAAFSLFTPLNEDWGIVPLESMAHAKAVIATARGGPLESVLDSQTGYLIPPDDDEAWSVAINRLVHDPELNRRLGEQAHEHVQRYTWRRFTATVDDAIEHWYLSLAAERQVCGRSRNGVRWVP